MRVRPAGVDSCTLTNALDKNGLPIRFKKDPHKVQQLIDVAREAEKKIEGLSIEDWVIWTCIFKERNKPIC